MAAANGVRKMRAVAEMKAGDDVTARGNDGATPLHLAAWHCGHLGEVEYLCGEVGAVVTRDDNGFTPLHVATWQGHLEVVASRCGDVGVDVMMRVISRRL